MQAVGRNGGAVDQRATPLGLSGDLGAFLLYLHLFDHLFLHYNLFFEHHLFGYLFDHFL